MCYLLYACVRDQAAWEPYRRVVFASVKASRDHASHAAQSRTSVAGCSGSGLVECRTVPCQGDVAVVQHKRQAGHANVSNASDLQISTMQVCLCQCKHAGDSGAPSSTSSNTADTQTGDKPASQEETKPQVQPQLIEQVCTFSMYRHLQPPVQPLHNRLLYLTCSTYCRAVTAAAAAPVCIAVLCRREQRS